MVDFITPDAIASADFLDGALLLVDKPLGWTSFDVVNKLRHTLRHLYHIKKIKVGHAGTLDPMATGLLLICTGKYTSKLAEMQGMDKTYTGTLILGATTASYDSETPAEDIRPFSHLNEKDILDAARRYTGEIRQLPPMFSAIKVGGQPLYRKARKGEEVPRSPRPIMIHMFEITDIALPAVHFKVVCSKGTYIRSLAHDLGQSLGCGAYLSALRRTRIGTYQIADAWSLDTLVKCIEDRKF